MTDSQSEAKRFAIKLLAYRGRSEAELRERLGKKGFPEEVIARTLGDLTRAGFLNDQALGEELKRQLTEGRHLGHRAAKQYMERRGLGPAVIRDVLTYDEEQELAHAQKLLDKKLGSVRNYLSENGKRKAWNYLARRGYSSGIIRKVLKEMRFSEEEHDEEHDPDEATE